MAPGVISRVIARFSRAAQWPLLALLALPAVAVAATSNHAQGLPFTRSYSFEEIGNVSRGARLGFDALGRIAVVRSGSCLVLNDTTWIDIADNEPGRITMQRIVWDRSGQAYYGATGTWGTVDVVNGMLRARSFVPTTFPKWVLASNFNDIVPTSTGVYFGGFGGIAYWRSATREPVYFEVQGVSRVFAIGETIYASSHSAGLQAVDVATGKLRTILPLETDGSQVDHVAAFDETHVLLSTMEGRLLIFDGTRVTPWPGALGGRPIGRVTSMVRLVDGNFAIAIAGVGLHLVSPQGEILSALTTAEYQRITDLATREPGVLWAAHENGVEKILYNSPITMFGQRLGLPASWPQVTRWKDQIIVASGGRLYESVAGAAGETTRFQLIPDQPTGAVWAIASSRDQLLIGTPEGVLVRRPDERFVPVLTGIDVARLVIAGDGRCYAIGPAMIAVLELKDGRWEETAPRVPGVGYPSVAHSAGHAAWIELGANRAARVELRDGKLEARLFENFPWSQPRWINVGVVGDTVVLSSPPQGRVFFDEKTQTFTEAPELKQLLDRAPNVIARLSQDQDGTIWASHDQGVFAFRKRDGRYRMDLSTYGRINDRFPLIQILPGGDIWMATSQALYHVEQNLSERGAHFRPSLVSITDARTNRELLPARLGPDASAMLECRENSLVLRFFAGSYAFRHPPGYEFTLHRGLDRWNVVGNGSLLTLNDLREGSYRLEARLTDLGKPVSAPISFLFEIPSPWYRTGYAYLAYVVGGFLAVFGLIRWSIHRTYARNVVLEKLVQERTNELRAAMEKLSEETRNAATVAERDRLAGEIHDSLQQGLSGLMLHLDATLKLTDLPADVRSRLIVARNMVSFTRHEVQHAVWDMETPLLEGTELGDALKKITSLIGAGAARVVIEVTGQPADLSPSTKHHLLRIAQEAITNAVRHAAAQTITIALAYEPTQVTLGISDDGNGFVPNDVLTKGIGHFGLRGLRGRASKIGGRLRIDSSPGNGTTVRVVVQTAVVPLYSHANGN